MLKKIIYGLAIFVLPFISVQNASAEIKSIEIKVDGLTCPFCVFGVEKKLKALDEIESVNTNLKSGMIEVALKQGKAVDIDRLNEAVRKSGFTPGDIKINANGTFTDSNGNPALKVSGTDQIFLLVGNKTHEKEELLSEEKIAEIKTAAENGKKEISVTGYIHKHGDFPPALSVESYEVM